MRQQAAFALVTAACGSGRARVDPEALKDSDEDVRQQAIFALTQLGAQAAVPAYIQALKDPSEDVREQALFGLSQLGNASAVPSILPLLKSDESEDVRQQAAFALSADWR